MSMSTIPVKQLFRCCNENVAGAYDLGNARYLLGAVCERRYSLRAACKVDFVNSAERRCNKNILVCSAVL